MFALLGIGVAFYVAYGVITGAVLAKAGPGMQVVLRDESPVYFWCVLACYAALALALIFVF